MTYHFPEWSTRDLFRSLVEYKLRDVLCDIVGNIEPHVGLLACTDPTHKVGLQVISFPDSISIPSNACADAYTWAAKDKKPVAALGTLPPSSEEEAERRTARAIVALLKKQTLMSSIHLYCSRRMVFDGIEMYIVAWVPEHSWKSCPHLRLNEKHDCRGSNARFSTLPYDRRFWSARL